MKIARPLPAVALLSAIALTLTACSSGDSPEPETPGESTPTDSAPADGEVV